MAGDGAAVPLQQLPGAQTREEVHSIPKAPGVGENEAGRSDLRQFNYLSGQEISVSWVEDLSNELEDATHRGLSSTSHVLPGPVLAALLRSACKAWQSWPALVELSPPEGAEVIVVGDTHGQFHDVRHMLKVAGRPSASTIYIFNGDYVDRGAWGVEVLATLAAYSLALPGSFFMLRGNHESSTCTRVYGFRGELDAKYGTKGSKAVFKACEHLFAALPLAALVAGKTLVLHGWLRPRQGGLFRKPAKTPNSKGKKRKRGNLTAAMELGSLADIRSAGKGGQDPSGLGPSQVASDIMWSDPVREEGLQFNGERGIGLMFGPDQTQDFLEANGLSLVLRSHEGPDARSRPHRSMPLMDPGYSVDHRVPAGCLMTVFSAPDYPQFQPVDDPSDRYNNLGAVAVLTAPSWASPLMRQYSAVLPRPEVPPFYDLSLPDSDEEFEPLPQGFESEADEPPSLQFPGIVPHAAAKRSEDAQQVVTATNGMRPRLDFIPEEDEMTVHWSSSVTGDGQPKNACQHPSNTSGAAQQSITESEVPHHRGDSHEVPDAAQEEYRPNKKAKIEDMKSHEGEESVVVVGADHKEQETFEIRPPECPEEGPPSAHNPLS